MPSRTDTLDRLEPNSRVAIIRLRSMGDCVLSTPAIRLLTEFRPDLRVAVVAEERFASLFSGEVLMPSARQLRAFAPRLCVNLHGGTRSARLTLLSGARFRAGFEIFKPGWIYNTPIPTAQEVLGVTRRVHTAEHMAAAMFYLGVPVAEVTRAGIPAEPGRSDYAPEGDYALIHPFASAPEKAWPVTRFVELARALEIEPVFIGGPGDDLSQFAKWRCVSGAPLSELARMARDASLFIGNDSGPAHVAAAFGVPCVVFFGASDSEIWAPWRTEAVVLNLRATVEEAREAVSARVR